MIQLTSIHSNGKVIIKNFTTKDVGSQRFR